MSDSRIPSAAQVGFADAASYDKHRPSYPAEAVEALLKNLQIAGEKGAKIVDLAAGTGKFTELLVSRPEEYEILAVEPHNGMRGELERKQLPRVTSLEGTATKIPVESKTADAIIIAQAWHWFANKEALKELHRVLKPAGVLGLIWNIEDYNGPKSWEPTTKWEGTMKDLTWSFDDNNPRFRHEKWRAVFDDQDKVTPFTIQAADPLFSLPIGEDSVQFTKWLSKEALWDRYFTLSQIAVLKGEELERVKKTVSDAVNSSDIETNAAGEIALHGKTFFAWTSSIPDESLKSFG